MSKDLNNQKRLDENYSIPHESSCSQEFTEGCFFPQHAEENN